MSSKVSSSELVGRSAELASLEDALTDARSSACTVLLSGEPGIGKSRLVAELVHRAGGTGWLVAMGGCSPVAGPDLPYGGVVSLLRSLGRGVDHHVLEPGLQALGVSNVGSPSTRPDAGTLGQTWLFETILGCLSDVSDGVYLMLVVEDIQWADHGTLGVLDFLTRNLGEHPVLLVCTCRSDDLDSEGPLRRFTAELARCGNVRRVDLHGLDRAALAAMAADILGGPVPARRLGAVERMSGGNPFFAEELLAVGDQAELPSTLRDVVMARVDGLSPAARHALGVVSVFGDHVENRLLAEAVDIEGIELDIALREAVGRGLLIVDGASYRFRHDLLREVLYNALLPGERRRLHGRVAQILDMAPDPDSRLTAELALHWSSAGKWEPALNTSLAAADAAMAMYAFEDALGQFDRALTAWDHLADAGGVPAVDRLEILGRGADAAYWGGRGERAVAFAAAAVQLTDSDANPLGAARCWTRLGRCAWAVGDPSGSSAALAEAERLLSPGEASLELARLQCEQARWFMLMSHHEQAVERARQAIDTSRAVGARLEEGHAANTLGVSLCMLGRPDEGLPLLRWALEVAEELGDPESLNRAYANLSAGLSEWGHLEEAAAITSDMVATGEHLEGIRLNGSAFNSAEALLRLGRFNEAELMIRDFGGTPSGNCASSPLIQHATLALLRGELNRAEPFVDELRRRTATLTDVQFRGSFHLLEAQLALFRGHPSGASDAVEQALGLAAGTDEQALAMELCAVGIRAVIDGALQAKAEGRKADDSKARLRAAELVDTADGLADRPRRQGLRPLPRTEAWLAQCRAEATRLGPPAPLLWGSAAAAWEALGEPLGIAYCRWRQGEAMLAGRTERAGASELVTGAWRQAVTLGAQQLRHDIEQTAHRARINLGSAVLSSAERAGSDLGLTAREVEVLGQLAARHTDAQIAEALFISKKTASVHVSNILRKLGVPGRVEAGDIGRHAGLG